MNKIMYCFLLAQYHPQSVYSYLLARMTLNPSHSIIIIIMTNKDVIKAYLASNPSNSGMCSLCCELYTETNPSVEYTLCHEIICRKCYFAFK